MSLPLSVAIALLVSVSLVLLVSAQLADDDSLPLTIPATDSQGRDEGQVGMCPLENVKNQVMGEIEDRVHAALAEKVLPLLCESGDVDSCAYSSCSHILQDNPNSESGYYWIQPSPGNKVQVYCDMTSTRCCNETGWTRIAYLNMDDLTQQCPPRWREIPADQDRPIRTCGRINRFSSALFPSNGILYSQVCGRVLGYQYGSTDAFSSSKTINQNYVDGISVTYGSAPRIHVWSFAAGIAETHGNIEQMCPCSISNRTDVSSVVPPFVGQDYFCETGTDVYNGTRFYETNPLWDGLGCGPQSSCCSFNNPPWFCKQLAVDTTDDIEVRICGGRNNDVEDTPVQLLEIFVQ